MEKATVLFGQAFRLYKTKWRLFVGIALLPAIIGGPVSLLPLLGNDIAGMKFSFGVIIVMAIVGIVGFASQILGQIAIFCAVKEVNLQESVGVMTSYTKAFSYFWAYIWVAMLSIFIVLGGFILLIVPGILFGVWVSLSLLVLVGEDVKGMGALLRSREYMRGIWGKVLWRSLFIGLVIMVVSFALSLLLKVTHVPFAQVISQFVSSLILVPFTGVYSFLLYRNIQTYKGQSVAEPTKSQRRWFVGAGILGLLAVPLLIIGLASLSTAQKLSRDAVRDAHVKVLKSSLEMYFDKEGVYPETLNELSPEYVTDVPLDPRMKSLYDYMSEKEGTDYRLCALFEKKGPVCTSLGE